VLYIADIVFCRTWYRVEVPKLYNPLTTLLLPPERKNLWQGMKTVGQLKREKGIRSEPATDSLYTVCIIVCEIYSFDINFLEENVL
jgi:ribosome biogenesis protein BMS1